MNIFIEKQDKHLKKDFSGTVAKLLRDLVINREVVIVVKNGEVVTDDELLSDDDDIKILSVISGG